MYALTAEDTALRDRARQFVDGLTVYEEDAEMNGGELPPGVSEKLRQQARELGLTATNMPVDLGGRGCSMLQCVLVQEQVGRATNALAWALSTPPSWWVPVASDFQRERWLRPACRGEAHECYAITEEGAGSDVDAITATARPDGDGYVLNGVKWHVTSFNEATLTLFEAKLSEGPNAGSHGLFAVDLPNPGVRVVRTPQYSHTFAHTHPVVAFEDVRVPATHLVGSEGDGMTFAYEWFRFERMMVAARCVGAAGRLVEEATAFASERVVYGKKVIDHGLVQGMLADSLTELYAARSMLYETARGVDEGRDPKAQHCQTSMVKLFCSEMAGRVADRAVQVFGGRGYMRENVAERYFRELRVERIWEGTSEVQRAIISSQLAKRGVGPFA